MNNITTNEYGNFITEVAKSSNINIGMQQWPAAVAVLGVCLAWVTVEWIHHLDKQQKAS